MNLFCLNLFCFDLNNFLFRDISFNPLACDCDLMWLVNWSNTRFVKLQPPPRCESDDFKGMYLKKLKVGVDLYCESPLQPLLEFIPKQNQVIRQMHDYEQNMSFYFCIVGCF